MKRPADVRLLLQRRFASQHRSWLGSAEQGDGWPAEITLGVPTEAQAMREPAAVRAWADEWRNWRGPGELLWLDRQWRTLGTQRLPSVLRISGADEVAHWAGQGVRWQTAQQRSTDLVERWPALRPVLGRLFDVLADYSAPDYQRLLATVDWLDQHPRSNLYLRQLPVAGVDSKWIESRRAVVAELIATLSGRSGAGQDFHELCGLRRPPQQLRLRILDPALRLQVGGLGDIIAPVEELGRLMLTPAHVLVVENLQTGLALDDLRSTVAILGLGYGVNALDGLPWIRGADCLYWGDIDTHGFAILSKARSVLPHLASLLMDEATLVQHRELWSLEPNQHGAAELPNLTAAEANLYEKLRNNSFGQGVRLEQERIDWGQAWLVVQRAVQRYGPRTG